MTANVSSSMHFNLSNYSRGMNFQLRQTRLLFPQRKNAACKVDVSAMQAVNISSELKLAVALSQSVWACAEKHCSAAL